jgi:hypothetical protein
MGTFQSEKVTGSGGRARCQRYREESVLGNESIRTDFYEWFLLTAEEMIKFFGGLSTDAMQSARQGWMGGRNFYRQVDPVQGGVIVVASRSCVRLQLRDLR